ncbi:uncharacterized protein LOC129292285 [Prosopis cineraria]|uniref:uncharacterized protein LOC129292285 n=1 Tax=Prosopis cineraria TaxID=364024 RepID=UPI00240FCA0A|nr:uncharacterized protein LOC129292285 [Prosopis cineraria]
MARSLPLNHLLLHTTSSSSSSSSQIGFAVTTLLLCAFALLMCASHSVKRRRQSWSSWFFGEDPEPVIEIIQNERVDVTVTSSEQHEEASIWQKNILMGGKCQLPDFSGVIIYDSEGNIVTSSKTPRPLLLTWK